MGAAAPVAARVRPALDRRRLGTPLKVLQVCARPRTGISGTWEHASRLAEQLARMGHEVAVMDPSEVTAGSGWDVIHLHYVPFSFSAWGAGAVPVAKRLARSAPVVLTVHEVRVGFAWSPRPAVFSLLQAVVLRLVARRSARVVITAGLHRSRMRGIRAEVIPSGSVLELDAQAGPPPSRRDMVGMMSSAHEGRMEPLAIAATRAAAAAAGLTPIAFGDRDVPGFEVPGHLDSDAFAAALGRCRLLVMPYNDGVTGRRTSFISALQVGTPVVTTLRPGMDDFATNGALVATLPEAHEAFVAAAAATASDAGLVDRLGSQGRGLFERELSWPVLAARLERVYREAVAGRQPPDLTP